MSMMYDYNCEPEYHQVKGMMFLSSFDPQMWNVELYSSWKWGKGEISPFRMKRDLVHTAREVAIYKSIFRLTTFGPFDRVSRELQNIEKKRFQDKASIYNVVCNDIYVSKCVEFADANILKELNNLETRYNFDSDEKQLNAVKVFRTFMKK